MSLKGMLKGLEIATSGLAAERMRMSVITQNIAMANVTRTIDGGPYVRRTVLFREALDSSMGNEGEPGEGVVVQGPVKDTRGEFIRVYDPNHPDADKDGYVTRSNVNLVYELLDLVIARRSYEANLAAFRTWQNIARRSIELMRS